MKTTTMQALAASSPGEWHTQLQFRSLPLPTLTRDHDVLIRVAYADLNPVDLHKLAAFRPPAASPESGAVPGDCWFVPGYSGSGTVLEASSAVSNRLPPGTRVGFLADPSRSGTYATHIVVDARCVSVLPDTVSLRDAATVPLAGLTALEALVKVGLGPLPHPLDAVAAVDDDKDDTTTPAAPKETQQQKRLLIVGGSGGVGCWATLLAKAWHTHLEVIATTSSIPASDEWCRQQGANRVIRHDDIDSLCDDPVAGYVNAILCLTEPTPSLLKQLSNVIRPYGSLCLVVAGTSINSLDLGFCFFKCANVATETVFSSFRTQFEYIDPLVELDTIYRLLASGAISQVPLSGEQDWTSALDRPGSLLEWLASGHARGKMVLHITGQEEAQE